MYLPDLVIRSRRVVTASTTRAATLHIRKGKFIGVLDVDDVPGGCPIIDAGDAVVMPGLVDTHVHVNEPGRTDWEGFASATRAAAAGGVTTIIDMPLNSVPATTTVEALEAKRESATGKCHVDVGFWGGVVPGNAPHLKPLVEAGALGFKCFLIPSGVDEFPQVAEPDLRAAMPIIAALGVPLLVHAELPGPVAAASDGGRLATLRRLRPMRRYAEYLATRPKAAENEAVELMIGLCQRFGTRTHIVHLCSSEALTPLYRARTARVPMTAETCPHYLCLAAEDIADGATLFKCAPPIRERENREFLWAALAGGLIQMVVSDHSPAPPALKRRWFGDFRRAWGGIASLQLSLAATWTEARKRGYTLEQVTDWMCAQPARLAGLHRKGAIAVGYDADVVIWNPDASFRVERSAIQHRHALTPYEGQILFGVVQQSYVRGQDVYMRGRGFEEARGKLLRRDG